MPKRFKKHSVQRLLATALLFFLAFAATLGLFSLIPPETGIGLRVEYTPHFEPPSDEYFFADAWRFELSQPTLYHALDESIDNARTADILFVGNSRMPIGLREEFIVPRAKEHGLKVFSLGSGHSERAGFALKVIRKHDLNPKIVVVVGGPHIYQHLLSDVAKESVRMTRWDAFKLRFETVTGWELIYRLHRQVPKLQLLEGKLTSPFVMYRSSRSGWWRPTIEPPWVYDVEYDLSPQDFSWILPFAEEFSTEMDQRGALLVATVVPYGTTVEGHLDFLEDTLGIPNVRLHLQGLTTNDGSHLDRRSAAIVSEHFWQEFMSLEEVRKRLGYE